jgi:cytidyltransferase-like protein
MIIFCDGIFDLFHKGHINHFKYIKELYPSSKLIVGILNDIETQNYKRKPIFNERKRKSLVDSCKYVDETTIDYPIIMTEEFMNKNKLDLIIHAFSDDSDLEKQKEYFEVPIRLNKMKVIPYNSGISTTMLINSLNNNSLIDSDKKGWDKIWELKGSENTRDLKLLNGYEETTFSHNECFNNIVNTLNIKEGDRVLEVGCGAGFFSKLFENNYDYFGIDYSNSMILKNIEINNSKVITCQANKLPFKDNYFDYTFSVGVFEYFPTKEYAIECIKELLRVSKKGIYIVNIRSKTHLEKTNKHKYSDVFQHLIYTHEDFSIFGDYKVIDASYERDSRFSILKLIDSTI